ncbi:DUF4102 domain-containing protein [Salmonella enterica subsp. salamae]|nr:DUF4102 domain-containing protein [Salmonella enterica subsp. salamae]
MAKKLTDTKIKNARPVNKEISRFDGDGLILRIAPLPKGGKRNLCFSYVLPASKRRMQNVSWPPLASL